jgi:hypothetical protein
VLKADKDVEKYAASAGMRQFGWKPAANPMQSLMASLMGGAH